MAGCVPPMYWQLLLVLVISLSKTVLGDERTDYEPVSLNVTFNDNQTIANVHSHSKVVVCYVATWAFWRPDLGKYDLLDKFNPDLCTHLIYSFAGLNNETYEMKSLDAFLDLEDDYGKGWYKKAAGLKQLNPHLKILLAVGGWNEGSERYSNMAQSPDSRSKFIQSALAFMRKYGFDGLDLDWEYPARRGGKPEDKQNFVRLVEELRSKFDKDDLMLTAAFGASPETAEAAYDLRELSRLLDHIHIMCYDYHGSWDKYASHNAPLYAPLGQLSVASTVDYFISQGADPNKLVLGLPLYGRTFLLNNVSEPGSAFEKPTDGKGFQGPFTREHGILGYNEICIEFATNHGQWTTYWDSRAKVPFMRNGAKWISFDNPESLYQKVEYGLSKGLRGAMVWSMDTDDFEGTCGGSKYPLLQSINYALALGSGNSAAVTTRPTGKDEKEDKKQDEKKGTKQDDKKHGKTPSSAGATAEFTITIIPILASIWVLLSNRLG